ncbi:hypothetical protein GCM10009808_08570 [Microbacterium sediminicola]|uniref:Uncharacterized protein n=1 Tax=Microbacterium sediminicola TaxID=415210 RepID=A0ABP4TTX8_9MICO
MPEVVITIDLRPSWSQRMMHALDSDEVTRRMEDLATSALKQFVRQTYVTVTATSNGLSRSLLRDRWDVIGNPMLEELRAKVIELQHRSLLLEELLRQAGISVP